MAAGLRSSIAAELFEAADPMDVADTSDRRLFVYGLLAAASYGLLAIGFLAYGFETAAYGLETAFAGTAVLTAAADATGANGED